MRIFNGRVGKILPSFTPCGRKQEVNMSPLKFLPFISFGLVSLLLIGCSALEPTPTPIPPTDTPVPTQTPPPIDPQEIGDLERGREIYETGGGVIERGCIGCHSLDGSVQTPVPVAAPSFQGISERAGDRVPELSAVDYLRQSIVDPSAYLVEGFRDNVMPKGLSFSMSEEDIVAFLLTQ